MYQHNIEHTSKKQAHHNQFSSKQQKPISTKSLQRCSTVNFVLTITESCFKKFVRLACLPACTSFCSSVGLLYCVNSSLLTILCSAYPSLCLSVYRDYLPICASVCSFVCRFVCLILTIAVCQPLVCPPACLPVDLLVFRSAWHSVCYLFVHM
jgi:hypothetical protein